MPLESYNSRMLSPVQKVSGEGKDGSERKRAEDALRRNEAYLAEAQRLSHTGSFGWHVSSGKIYWTEETFRIFEFETPPSTTLERVFERIHPEDRKLVTETINSAARERKNFDFEHRLLMPDGSVKHVRVMGRPSTNDESGDLEFVGAVTEITQRKNVEEALRRSEQQLRDVIETIPAMAWTTDPNGSRDFANHRWQDFTGMSVSEMAGDGWKKMIHPADLARHTEKCHHSLTTGTPFENEVRVRRASDGQFRWFLHRGVAMRDEAGNILKWFGTGADIEDLKRAEVKLRQDEQELRRITGALPLPIVVLNPECRAICRDKGGLDYTGLTLDGGIDKKFSERIFH